MKNTLCIHHSAINTNVLPEQFERIKNEHHNRGFGTSSAYHLFSEKDGTVRTGRSVLRPSAGTRSRKANWNYLHVCVAGNFEEEEPTPAQIESLKQIIQAHKIDKVVGHRDCSASLCPGKNLYKLTTSLMSEIIPEWGRETAFEMKEAGITTPPTERVENIPLYQLVLLIKKLLKYWGVIK